MTQTILVVEDEEKIARLLEIELELEGYKVSKANNGLDAWQQYQEGNWDLILLDVMLPGLSGIELLRRIRQQSTELPILLLTARTAVEDKVAGLDLGANDYITKPFQIEELLARIRSALRISSRNTTNSATEKPAAVDASILTIADLTFNERTREVMRSGQYIELTPREFDLLKYLLQHAGQVMAREQILEAVWGYDYYGETNIVDVYIRYVRKKLDTGHDTPLLHTVRGVGYVLRENR